MQKSEMTTESHHNGMVKKLQFLLDEDGRTITYKFVSCNFNIHLNAAKEQLRSLLKHCRSTGDNDVTATYLLSGTGQEPGTSWPILKVLVVAEDQLERARALLTSVRSEHVYSVQRHRVCDTSLLHAANLQEQATTPEVYNRHGAIRNERAVAIPEAELLMRSRQAVPVTLQVRSKPPSARPATNSVPVKSEQPAADSRKDRSASDGTPETNNQPASGDALKTSMQPVSDGPTAHRGGKQPAGIASMFARAKTANEQKEQVKKSPVKKAGSGMMANFLSKGAQQKADPEPEPNRGPPAAASELVKDGTEGNTAPVRFGAKKKATEKSRGAVKRKSLKKPAGGGSEKKRRRILAVASDSSESSSDEDRDSDDEPAAEEEEEEKPGAPVSDEDEAAAEPQKSAEAEQPTQKRRKRKLVDKTFVDSEGFMVTKKMYESCSESDSEQPTAAQTKSAAATEEIVEAAEKSAPPKEPAPDRKSSPQKTKQANIMNFFKKK